MSVCYSMKRERRTRVLSLFPFFMLIFLSVSSYAENNRSDYDLDDDGLIEINDLADLNEIRNNLDGTSLYGENTGCLASACNGFELTTNLDFDSNQDDLMDEFDAYWNNGEGWLPIGHGRIESTSFRAIFEGNNYVINNLYINRVEHDDPADEWQGIFIGLFNSTTDAHIRNLGLEGRLMSVTGYYAVGALIGRAISNTKVENCHSVGSVTAESNYAAGLVAQAFDNSEISNSFNKGFVLGHGTVGGLVGILDDSQIIASFNSGKVKATIDFVGGLVGETSSGAITNSFNVGRVQGSESVGGLVGFTDSNTQVLSTFSSGQILGESDLGGLVADRSVSAQYSVNNSYWAIDTSEQLTSYGENESNSYVGLKLSVLQCAVNANRDYYNSNCVSIDGSYEGLDNAVTLYKDWDNYSNWDFGNSRQLPGLIISGVLYRDGDGDGVLDGNDPFPYDTDNDESDNHNDAFPFDATESIDADLDGIGNNADIDDDNDNVPDILDAFPLDYQESVDTDGDGVGNNSDTDDDGDGVVDAEDADPLDASVWEYPDTDSDGVLDSNDIDDDNNGLIEISNLDDLNEIRNNLSGSAFYGVSTGCPISGCNGFELTNNLDFDSNQDGQMNSDDPYWNSGEGWLPIGDVTLKFSAIFDGNGHVIDNLFINRPTSNYIALFASAQHAEIRNLGLGGSLMSVSGDSAVGGFVGGAGSGGGYISITNAHVKGNVDGAANVGGIAGDIGANSEVINCYNTATITSNGSGAGGIVGVSSLNSVVTASYSTGDIFGSTAVGGLIGQTFLTNVDASFSTGFVQGSFNVGGLIGQAVYSSITNSYWATDASGQIDSSESSVSMSYLGFPLATMECAVNANTSSSSDCINTSGIILYQYWDDVSLNNVWDFGTDQQLPALVLNSVVHRDSDNDGVMDANDAFPLDATEFQDQDNDSVGNNADIDDDNDGLIELNNLADLNEIRHNLSGSGIYGVSSGCPVNGCIGFELTRDLNFDSNNDNQITQADEYWNNGEGWLSIGDSSNPFSAVFEGNKFEILNLFINRPNTSDTGLFGAINNAHVRNIGLSGELMSVTGRSLVGALVGRVMSGNVISHSNNSGAVHGYVGIGGLLGFLDTDNQIFNSYNEGVVTSDYGFVGGLIGYLNSNNQVLNSYNQGPVTAQQKIGGLVGNCETNNEIRNSYSTGTVTGDSELGGLVGVLNKTGNTVHSSFSTATVQSSTNNSAVAIGGLVGSVGASNHISLSFSTGKVESDNISGGLIGSASSDAIIENSYWAIDTSGLESSSQESEANSYVGLELAALICAIHSDTEGSSSHCVSQDGLAEGLDGPVILYQGWGANEAWDFGTNQQLPGLIINGVVHRDSNGDGEINPEPSAAPVLIVFSDLLQYPSDFNGQSPYEVCQSMIAPNVKGAQTHGVVPFISTAETDLVDQVPLAHQNRMLVGPNGLDYAMANNWQHLFSDTPLIRALYDGGINYQPKRYHSGTDSNGRLAAGANCDNWSSSDANKDVNIGTIESSGRYTYSYALANSNCGETSILMCVAY